MGVQLADASGFVNFVVFKDPKEYAVKWEACLL